MRRDEARLPASSSSRSDLRRQGSIDSDFSGDGLLDSSGDCDSSGFPMVRAVSSISPPDTGLRIFPPLSQFWQDVPFAGLPLLKSGSEVHIKLGPNVLTVDRKGKGLGWENRMRKRHLGYLRSMNFVIDRRAERR